MYLLMAGKDSPVLGYLFPVTLKVICEQVVMSHAASISALARGLGPIEHSLECTFIKEKGFFKTHYYKVPKVACLHSDQLI